MYILYGGRFTRAILVEMVMAEGGIAQELRARFREIQGWVEDCEKLRRPGAGAA